MSDKLAGGIKAGSTSVSLPIILRKTADNTEMTGKVAADMTAYYWRQGGTPTALTALSNLAAITSAFSAGGVKEADATNQPGAYRLDVDDAAFATGADWVIISVKVASAYVFFEKYALTTNVVQTGDSFGVVKSGGTGDTAAIKAKTDSLTFTGANKVDASCRDWAGTTITATSIPVATAAGASGGLFIAGTNAPVTITGSGNALTLTSTGANGAGLFSTGNGSGDGISATGGTTGNGFHGASGTGGSSGIRAECKGTNGDGFTAIGFGTGDGIAATGGATGRGIHAVGGASSGAGIRAEGTAGNAAGVEFVHQGTGKDFDATTTNLVLAKTTNITGLNDIAATDVVSAGAITTSGGAVVTTTNLTTNNDKTGYALTSSYDFAKGTVAMTESYNTDGAAPTPAQALMGILQNVTEFSISGTTVTVKKLDGSTTAMTLTLDDGTTPTAVTRSG